jgi:N-acetylmuramoyl-L-alanine amidase
MRRIILLLSLFSLLSFHTYPFYIAKIAKDKINIRVDSTSLSPSIGYLNKGEKVRIIEERFDWCKIILPKRFTCYVASEFIREIGGNIGEVTASNLNLRAEPSLFSHTLGKVSKGTILFIKEKNKGWFKVRGYPYTSGWVHKSFLQK